MKKTLVAIAALLVSVASYGQGQIVFNTHITTAGAEVDARVLNPDLTPAVDQTLHIELDIINGNGSLTPLTTPSAAVFKTSANGAGYVNAGAATAPAGFPDQTIVNLRYQVYNGVDFATSTLRGSSDLFNVKLQSGNNAPLNLIGLQGFTLVQTPEPTTLALGAIGIGALLLRRRK